MDREALEADRVHEIIADLRARVDQLEREMRDHEKRLLDLE
jgi:hypothetical protein